MNLVSKKKINSVFYLNNLMAVIFWVFATLYIKDTDNERVQTLNLLIFGNLHIIMSAIRYDHYYFKTKLVKFYKSYLITYGLLCMSTVTVYVISDTLRDTVLREVTYLVLVGSLLVALLELIVIRMKYKDASLSGIVGTKTIG